jgi:hypothetical protein
VKKASLKGKKNPAIYRKQNQIMGSSPEHSEQVDLLVDYY